MSYALDVEPDAMKALGILDIDVQEAVFDLLDRLAAEVSGTDPAFERHDVSVRSPAGHAWVVLEIVFIHAQRTLRVVRLRAIIV